MNTRKARLVAALTFVAGEDYRPDFECLDVGGLVRLALKAGLLTRKEVATLLRL